MLMVVVHVYMFVNFIIEVYYNDLSFPNENLVKAKGMFTQLNFPLNSLQNLAMNLVQTQT